MSQVNVDIVVHNAEVDGRYADVAITGGKIVAVRQHLHDRLMARDHVDGLGRALLPGIHDHHLHLMAMASALGSLDLEANAVRSGNEFASLVRAAASFGPADESLRVVGYHESIHGPLDRWALDALGAARSLRVQHRSGASWILDSKALSQLPQSLPPGAEHDQRGVPTGRFKREDRWLRDHLPNRRPPNLAPVGTLLSSHGITGVTDMTPFESPGDLEMLADARRSGVLPQHIVATGGPSLTEYSFPIELGVGPVKLVVDEFALPPLDDLVARIQEAHTAGRAVAIHCVGRVTLALVIAALDTAGAVQGDRIEHGSVVPPEFHEPLRALRCTVVTQPGFVSARGDQYLLDVEADDMPHLWPCGSLICADIPVGCSSDAPYGPVDPWHLIAAATERTTRGGRVIGASERITPQEALARALSPLDNPGGPPRRIVEGAPADLVLLDRQLTAALASPTEVVVDATWIDGVLAHQR